jgi:3-hydroxymyristoyl/3-hydroxydecanoyl-(acyl carrier protein) dehydratase
MRLLPDVLAERRTPGRVELDLRVPEELAYFGGHFPGAPILPGVVQLDWSVRYARERLGLQGGFRAAQNLKFHSVVRPGAQLTLTLEGDGARQFHFNFFSKTHKVSSGTLLFAA